MGKDKYNFYDYKKDSYRGTKKSKSKKKTGVYDEYSDIKKDFSKLFCDIKKVFSNKKGKVFKVKKINASNNEKLVKKACIGLLGFVIMSFVLTFPIALIITLILSFVYMKKVM